MSKIYLHIANETNELKAVVLGIGTDQGKPYDINPVAKMHKEEGTYPTEDDVIAEIATVEAALKAEGVTVFRPKNMPNQKQIFTRDIGFVIDDKFVVANMKEPVRKAEIEGIQHVLDQLDPDSIIEVPEGATIEGGDVLVHQDHVFVGISKRTNQAGFEFLKATFLDKQVIGLNVVVSDDPKKNILHLDCAFQPVGDKYAIIYEDGFQDKPQSIYDLFGEENLIKVNQQQMNRMFPNVFSVSPKKVLVEEGFTTLIDALESRNIQCIKVKYAETSKLSGLLRCSTLPLIRA
ncbi:N-dimethylarginine dimethylaminohydrolase [Roseivirga pacifica]|uniref:arginine deiminase n=1 Tax=Roseivirga pacifica TaxID=1267423 RepID=A0A1I0QBQ3_9BACT|nr:arginine deiminase family protein [Roseivirga pacifica]RKQ43063.1 N-dimethylarginine dimethylaminohydrolase [Roseivirga pacifica]SEW24479.1 N-Dimethylarginine dimethylaminohydrolase [Roseivirga pacifica]